MDSLTITAVRKGTGLLKKKIKKNPQSWQAYQSYYVY